MNNVVEHKSGQVCSQVISDDNLSPLVRAAMAGNINTDALKQLLDIQKDYEKHESEKAFHLALSEFKKNNLTLDRDKLVSFTTSKGKTEYRHTTLGAALSEVNPLLGENGLSLTWETSQGDGGRITVKAVLSHSKGFSKSTSLSGSPDESGGKNNIQAIGSTVSYLERYTAFALLGVASIDMDNDGAGGQASDKPASEETSLQPYPQDKFDKNLAAWRGTVASGKSTADKIIKMISSKYILSDDQKKKISEPAKDKFMEQYEGAEK